MTADPQRLIDPQFWKLPLESRMLEFAEIREAERFPYVGFVNDLTGEDDGVYAVTRYDDVVDVSKRPEEFCSGKGAVSVVDMSEEMLEFFGSFINMDNPRHAHQRRIVAHSFTPTQLQGVLDSVETICGEVIDGFCEHGQADLVKVLSQPYPLLVICDMMGIPRSEFTTVLDATNIILGGGDPEFMGDGDPLETLIGAGIQLVTLMTELVEARRKNPTDDLTSKLVHHDLGEDLLTPAEISSFFILLAVAGNETTRNAISWGMHQLTHHPDQRELLRDNFDDLSLTAADEIVRWASPVIHMRRVANEDVDIGRTTISAGEKVVMWYWSGNRDEDHFPDGHRFDITRPNTKDMEGYGAGGPHFCLGANLARREIQVMYDEIFRQLPDLEITGEPDRLVSGFINGIKRMPCEFSV
jgi:cytochrome P450